MHHGTGVSVCLPVCLSVYLILKVTKINSKDIKMYYMFYYLLFLSTGCIRKPLHTETTRQTQETGRQEHYHGKYTCTQTVGVQMHSDTVGTPALKHCGYTYTHCGHTCTETLGWGVHVHSDTVGTSVLTVGTPALRHLGGGTPTLRHCGYTCTHRGHTCAETLGWGYTYTQTLWVHLHSPWAHLH